MSELDKIQSAQKSFQDIFSTLEELSLQMKQEHPVYQALEEEIGSDYFMKNLNSRILSLLEQIRLLFLGPAGGGDDEYFHAARRFLFADLSLFREEFSQFFYRLMSGLEGRSVVGSGSRPKDPLFLFSASFFLFDLNARSLQTLISKYFDHGFEPHEELEMRPENDPVWNVQGLKYKDFFSDYSMVRKYADTVLSEVFPEEKSRATLLHLQVSEFIKNAVRHGNKMDESKKVKVWYGLEEGRFRLIVEDEGKGFKSLNKWNAFNCKRNRYIKEQNLEKILKHASFRTADSHEDDGGNFLFSALEYWDSGVIFNRRKNRIAVVKYLG